MDNLQNRSLDPIEDALQSLPIAPAPVSFKTGVMRRVRAVRSVPTFSFPWLEVSLSLIAASMVTGAAFLLAGVSPLSLRLFELQVRVYFQNPAHAPFLALVILIPALVFITLLAGAFFLAGRHPMKVAIRRKAG
jgi:hypothetical protein